MLTPTGERSRPPNWTERLFFALFPDAAVAMHIGALARRLRAANGLKGELPSDERLHVTLYHVGDFIGVPNTIVDDALKAASSLSVPSFELAFDRALSFATGLRKRAFVLAGGEGVTGVSAFQRALSAALDYAGVGQGSNPAYVPHVTLLHDEKHVREQPIETVAWVAREFLLIRSPRGKGLYLPLARWRLG